MFNRKICRWNFFVIKIYQFEFWRRWNSIHKINLWWQALTVNYLLSDWNIFHLNLRMKTISFSSTRTTNAWKITIFVLVARLNRPKRFCEWLLRTFSRNSEQCWKKDFRWVIFFFCFFGFYENFHLRSWSRRSSMGLSIPSMHLLLPNSLQHRKWDPIDLQSLFISQFLGNNWNLACLSFGQINSSNSSGFLLVIDEFVLCSCDLSSTEFFGETSDFLLAPVNESERRKLFDLNRCSPTS